MQSRRAAAVGGAGGARVRVHGPAKAKAPAAGSGGASRALRKELQRLERALDRLTEREAELHAAMAQSATDHARLRELQAELDEQAAQRERVEAAWLRGRGDARGLSGGRLRLRRVTAGPAAHQGAGS